MSAFVTGWRFYKTDSTGGWVENDGVVLLDSVGILYLNAFKSDFYNILNLLGCIWPYTV